MTTRDLDLGRRVARGHAVGRPLFSFSCLQHRRQALSNWAIKGSKHEKRVEARGPPTAMPTPAKAGPQVPLRICAKNLEPKVH
jgi:hypothetical protein